MKKASTLSLPGKQFVCPNSPMAKRTKQEVRMAQKVSFCSKFEFKNNIIVIN